MFAVHEFADVKEAAEHMKKVLAELETPGAMEFEVIYAISETECSEDGGEWNDVGEIILDYLYDLDATQGYMNYETGPNGYWGFVEWAEPDDDDDDVHHPVNLDDIYVYAGEGLVVIHNKFAVCENQFPLVVLKKSFWESQPENIMEMLKYSEIDEDYTSKICPAVYVELYYPE